MTSARTRERLIGRLREEGISDERVLEVMNRIPRHIFVDEALASRAYEDTALPIGFGQTISQPYIVARMTAALLRDGPLNKVLEIGTGSAYQAAILSQLATKVYSVERISALLDRARRVLRELKVHNVDLRYSDGTVGLPEEAPFDGIIATAAPHQIPQALLSQLADGGRLVIPVGPRGAQRLSLITRRDDQFEEEILEPVSFVPMLTGAN
ncbi:MAG: protein-L-isoaspartate(D-aspartate) O-methyltransferase [Gammaproteobacteria bacterium]|nr:protein-L-isoaspartate(D-aspartate) O-methyltransferase [Gammaproteobacteria bacterium]